MASAEEETISTPSLTSGGEAASVKRRAAEGKTLSQSKEAAAEKFAVAGCHRNMVFPVTAELTGQYQSRTHGSSTAAAETNAARAALARTSAFSLGQQAEAAKSAPTELVRDSGEAPVRRRSCIHDATSAEAVEKGKQSNMKSRRGKLDEKKKKTFFENLIAHSDTSTHLEELQNQREEGTEKEKVSPRTSPTQRKLSKKFQFLTEGDFRGRPLHEQVHCGFRATLLSHHTKHLNLRGFLNLFLILLFVINFRLVLDNLMEYGLMIRLPSGFDDILANWPILLCFGLMHFCIILAYITERFVASWVPYLLDWSEMVLIGINFFLVFLMPYLTVYFSSPDPASAALLLGFSVVWLFKLYSFHAVCYDVRKAILDDDNLQALCDHSREEVEACKAYPSSITLRHLYMFICMPTMCFQFHYPRVPRIRWLSVARHVIESAVCLALMKIVIDQYIVPVVRDSFTINELHSIPLSTFLVHFLNKIITLSVPNLYVWLLMFVGLFHHWCNILAELTRFGDRQFYLDWWNASSFGEYWRKWNIPIHQFLNRHVNKPLRRARFPRSIATFVVFMISALLHEYMVSVPLQLGWTGWVFLAFLAQAPLTYLTNLNFFQSNPTVGNCFFWFTFCFSGQPLGILIYWYLWGVKHGEVQVLDPSKIQIM